MDDPRQDKFLLKMRTRHGDTLVTSLTADSSADTLARVAEGLVGEGAAVLGGRGFPPKRLPLHPHSTLAQLGIQSGDILTVQAADEGRCRAGLFRKPVPADNSCLFTSIGFVLNGKVDTTVGSYMREIIAQVVGNDRDTYSEAFLGRPNLEYCTWIMEADSWGGAIEISVLSRFYGIEMDVVDAVNAIVNRFGEDRNYGQRVFLFFDGSHYDPLYSEGPQSEIQTIFPTEDEDVLEDAERLAREARQIRRALES